MPKTKLRGCYTALITPFEQGNRLNPPINFRSLDTLIERQIREDVDGIVIAGSTGCAACLSHDEHVALVKHAQQKFGKRIKIIAGSGSNYTYESINLARKIEKEAGVYLHLSISPYYVKPSDSGIFQHYKEIIEHIEGEIILYSVPSRTSGLGITPKVAEELAQHPRIIGIKEASGDLERIKETIKRTHHKDFFILSGDDSLTLPIIRAGGVGVISVASNLTPSQINHQVHFALGTQNQEHSWHITDKLENELKPLYSTLFPKARTGVLENPSPNPCLCYYALNQMGFDTGIPRLPLTTPESWEKEAMNKVLKDLKLIKN